LQIIDASQKVGANHARNCGVALAAGRLLAFCDADDVASPTWLAHMAEAGAHASFLGGPLDLDALNDARQRHWYGQGSRVPGIRPFPGFFPFVTSANLGLQAELARELVPFDTRLVGSGDDVALSWSAAIKGHRPVEVPDAVMHYRLRPSGVSSWRHYHLYGQRQVTLYRYYAALGMPRRSPVVAAGSWAFALAGCVAFPFLAETAKINSLRVLAFNSGRVVGSIRERVLFL
jgi:glycosyltransferase involved in cell wall biosynthesis